MTRVSPGWLVTPRDVELLRALDYAPLTARQLEKLSMTWEAPFRSTRLVRERLQRMGEAKLVSVHRYAILDRGQPENYYLLSRRGYRLLHGPDSQPPTKGYFSPAGLARQPHQRAVSDFVVHTACGAHRSGIRFTGFYRENTIRLAADGQSIYPDASFALVTRDDKVFRFFVEIDNDTERIRSQKDADSIERKIRTYDAVQDQSPERRGSCSSPRRIPQRDSTTFSVTSPLFVDHRGDRQSLVPDIRAGSLLAPAALMPRTAPC